MPVAHLKALAFCLVLLGALHAQARYELRSIPDDVVTMEPAVRARAFKVFRTDGGVPPRGSVVWFEHPAQAGRFLLARVVAGPGERIAIRAGRAVRDGKALPEDYAEKRVELEDLAEVVVPAGHVYVLNDARGDPGSPGKDSRRLGPIPVAQVVGWLRDRIGEREAEGGR